MRNCSCEPEKILDPQYRLFNSILILVILPIVAITGLVCNILSMLVYTRRPLVKWSVNHYLAALAVADFSVDFCGIFVIVADSARTISPILQWIYVRLLPFIFPCMLAVQTLSIYLTVAAAFDCFFSVCTTHWMRQKACRTKVANRVVFLIVLFSLGYNIVAFLELERLPCRDWVTKEERFEVCATELRRQDAYVTIFKGWMYMGVMAVIPFVLLLSLNLSIILTVCRLKRSNHLSPGQDAPASDSTIMLVMVVVLFLFCNVPSLVVAVLEMAIQEEWYRWEFRHYLIDAGNFLVAFNSSANFFVYITFSQSFRTVLSRILSRSGASDPVLQASTIKWSECDYELMSPTVNGSAITVRSVDNVNQGNHLTVKSEYCNSPQSLRERANGKPTNNSHLTVHSEGGHHVIKKSNSLRAKHISPPCFKKKPETNTNKVDVLGDNMKAPLVRLTSL